ncbi:tetratricopeptide repeat protein [Streptomyces sp. NPDC002004]
MRSEQEQPVPPEAWPPPAPPPRHGGRSRRGRRLLGALVAGSVVLGGAWWLLPGLRNAVVRPAPGPGVRGAVVRAETAVAAGLPATLSDLTALIGDHEAYLRKHPGDVKSWAVLGSAYLQQGVRTADPAFYPRAERALRASLDALPGRNPDALLGLASLADARGDFSSARAFGEQTLKVEPKRWQTYPVLIDAYSRLGDYKAAQDALDKLMKLNTGTSALTTAARVYRDRAWREDAAALLGDAAARAGSPTERAAALQQAGDLAWERGEPGEALGWYDAALAADPDRQSALAGKARALAGLGRTAEAVRAYQGALAKQPRPEYALELGELFEAQGMSEAAQGQYDAVRARVKEDAAYGVDDQLVLGRLEADHGDPREAVSILRAEVEQAGSTEANDALGWALHQAGDDDGALTYAQLATAKGTVRSALFTFHLGEIERALDDDGPARRHLTDALRVNPAFSPLLVPRAKQGLAALGDPPPGGPTDMDGPAQPMTSPSPTPSASAASG